MNKNKFQTRLVFSYWNPEQLEVEIERRRRGIPRPDQLGTWYETRAYTPTNASRKRLERVVNTWIKKDWVTVLICSPLVEIEVTA